MCVICVLCLIVAPLAPCKNPFAVKINNNNIGFVRNSEDGTIINRRGGISVPQSKFWIINSNGIILRGASTEKMYFAFSDTVRRTKKYGSKRGPF
jgi:hypothetical protein